MQPSLVAAVIKVLAMQTYCCPAFDNMQASVVAAVVLVQAVPVVREGSGGIKPSLFVLSLHVHGLVRV